MEHENCIGESDEWYTPPWVFERLGMHFDVDVCSPGPDHWVPASRVITKEQCALKTDWGDSSFVFMNPPFGGRNFHVPFLQKFLAHPGGGIAICRAYTSAGWFHDQAIKAHGLFFPRGKTKFIRPDGSIGTAPGGGVVLLGNGDRACEALSQQTAWGWFVDQRTQKIGAV